MANTKPAVIVAAGFVTSSVCHVSSAASATSHHFTIVPRPAWGPGPGLSGVDTT
jgi:hypothetical protein